MSRLPNTAKILPILLILPILEILLQTISHAPVKNSSPILSKSDDFLAI